jgi:hypothetical protein
MWSGYDSYSDGTHEAREACETAETGESIAKEGTRGARDGTVSATDGQTSVESCSSFLRSRRIGSQVDLSLSIEASLAQLLKQLLSGKSN